MSKELETVIHSNRGEELHRKAWTVAVQLAKKLSSRFSPLNVLLEDHEKLDSVLPEASCSAMFRNIAIARTRKSIGP